MLVNDKNIIGVTELDKKVINQQKTNNKYHKINPI